MPSVWPGTIPGRYPQSEIFGRVPRQPRIRFCNAEIFKSDPIEPRQLRRGVAGKVIMHRHKGIPTIPRDVDVADLPVEWQAIDRQVRLGKAARLRRKRRVYVRRRLLRASIQGETVDNARTVASPNTSEDTICCIHVVPHFGAVAMMTSPWRGWYSSQRRLSMPQVRYSLIAGLIIVVRFPSPVSVGRLAWNDGGLRA